VASLLSHLDRVTLSCGLLAQLERRVGWALTIDRVDVAEQGEGGHAGGDRVDQAELGLLHQVLIREIDGHRVQLVERAAGQRADGLGRLQQALGGDGCAERQQRQREREHGCETAGPQPFWFFVVSAGACFFVCVTPAENEARGKGHTKYGWIYIKQTQNDNLTSDPPSALLRAGHTLPAGRAGIK
jgi:hypothetical protein